MIMHYIFFYYSDSYSEEKRIGIEIYFIIMHYILLHYSDSYLEEEEDDVKIKI
jgi:hypothetical protein